MHTNSSPFVYSLVSNTSSISSLMSHRGSHGPILHMVHENLPSFLYDCTRTTALGAMDDGLRTLWERGYFKHSPLLSLKASQPDTIYPEPCTLYPSPMSALTSAMRTALHAIQKTHNVAWIDIGNPPPSPTRSLWFPNSNETHRPSTTPTLCIVRVGLTWSAQELQAHLKHPLPARTSIIIDACALPSSHLDSILNILGPLPDPLEGRAISIVGSTQTGLGLLLTKTPPTHTPDLDQVAVLREQGFAPIAPNPPNLSPFRNTFDKTSNIVQKVHIQGQICTFQFHTQDDRDRFIQALQEAHVLAIPCGTQHMALSIPDNTHRNTIARIARILQNTAHRLFASHSPTSRQRSTPSTETRVRAALPEEADELVPAIMDLEAKIFEPARRDSAATLRKGFDPHHGVAIVAEARPQPDAPWTLVGYALGSPATWFTHLDGPRQDPLTRRDTSLYSMAISIDPAYQGYGLGRRLKTAQIEHARTLQNEDGSPRYAFVTGRNRVRHTDSMMRINRALGGYTVAHFTHQYGEVHGEAVYYRIPLHPRGPALEKQPEPYRRDVSCIATPLRTPPPSLHDVYKRGELCGPTLYAPKLSKYSTQSAQNALDDLRALLPTLPHLHTCASLSDAFEFVTCWASSLAQSPNRRSLLALPGTWDTRPAPLCADSTTEPPHNLWGAQTLEDALIALNALFPHPENACALITEPVQHSTGRTLSAPVRNAISQWCQTHAVPWVVLEETSALFRAGETPFASNAWETQPNAVLWWAGGHIACVHTDAQPPHINPADLHTFTGGDELALLRLHHTLNALRSESARSTRARAIHAFQDFLAKHPSFSHHCATLGCGLFRRLTPKTPEAQAALQRTFQRHRITLQTASTPQPSFLFAPALDTALEDTQLVLHAARDLLLLKDPNPKVDP